MICKRGWLPWLAEKLNLVTKDELMSDVKEITELYHHLRDDVKSVFASMLDRISVLEQAQNNGDVDASKALLSEMKQDMQAVHDKYAVHPSPTTDPVPEVPPATEVDTNDGADS